MAKGIINSKFSRFISSLPKPSSSQIIVLVFLAYLEGVYLAYLFHKKYVVVPWDEFLVDYELKRGHPPPRLLEHWLEYAKRNSCPSELYEGIYTDLERFRNFGLTEADVLSAVDSCPTCKLIKLDNGQLYIDGSTGSQERLRWILQPVVEVPGLRFLMAMNWDDRPAVRRSEDPFNTKPIFSWSVHKDGSDGDLRFPYIYGIFLWKPDDEIIWGLRDWKKRRDALVWRGTTTGTVINKNVDWRNTHRFKMVSKLGHHATMIGGIPADVGFTEILQCEDDTECERAKQEFSFGMRKKVPFGWFSLHKYVLDMDGNSFSARFTPLLRSGSIVFKAGQFNQWFSERVLPWEHYIPVNITLDDLDEKVAWAVENSASAEKISTFAAETASKVIRDVDSRCYAYRLMIEYASLFRKSKTADN